MGTSPLAASSSAARVASRPTTDASRHSGACIVVISTVRICRALSRSRPLHRRRVRPGTGPCESPSVHACSIRRHVHHRCIARNAGSMVHTDLQCGHR